VSALVTALPTYHRYKIIFMRRPIQEILASQHRMRFGKTPSTSDERMVAILRKHEEQTLVALRARQIELLEVDYSNLVRDLLRYRDLLSEFLGPERLPHIERIAEVVRPDLRRIQMTE